MQQKLLMNVLNPNLDSKRCKNAISRFQTYLKLYNAA